MKPPPPPRRPPSAPPPEPRLPEWMREPTYVIKTWRFQRLLVLLWLVPAPLCALLLLHKSTGNLTALPWAWPAVGLLSSIGITLLMAFAFWRCPECNRVLYATTGRTAPGLFFLGDPDHCPDCGVRLRQAAPPPPARQEKRSRSR